MKAWFHLRTLARTHVRENAFRVRQLSLTQHLCPRRGKAGTSTPAFNIAFPLRNPSQKRMPKTNPAALLVNWSVLQKHQVPYLAKAIILRRWSHSLCVSTLDAPNKSGRVTTSKCKVKGWLRTLRGNCFGTYSRIMVDINTSTPPTNWSQPTKKVARISQKNDLQPWSVSIKKTPRCPHHNKLWAASMHMAFASLAAPPKPVGSFWQPSFV